MNEKTQINYSNIINLLYSTNFSFVKFQTYNSNEKYNYLIIGLFTQYYVSDTEIENAKNNIKKWFNKKIEISSFEISYLKYKKNTYVGIYFNIPIQDKNEFKNLKFVNTFKDEFHNKNVQVLNLVWEEIYKYYDYIHNIVLTKSNIIIPNIPKDIETKIYEIDKNYVVIPCKEVILDDTLKTILITHTKSENNIFANEIMKRYIENKLQMLQEKNDFDKILKIFEFVKDI